MPWNSWNWLDEWGTLRVWAGGASRVMDYFETDKAVDAKQVGLEGHAVQEARALLAREPLLAPVCHEVLARHLRARGDHENADKEWGRGMRAAALAELARWERQGASLDDPLEPHACASTDLDRIQRLLLSDGRVREAHLARKTVRFHAERPVLVLVVKWKGVLWDPFGRKRQAFQQELQEVCPFPPMATGFVQVAGGASFWRHGSRLKKLGALIFRR